MQSYGGKGTIRPTMRPGRKTTRTGRNKPPVFLLVQLGMAVAAIIIGITAFRYYGWYEKQEDYEIIAERNLVDEETGSTDDSEKNPAEKKDNDPYLNTVPDIASLKMQNKDCYGWITIPDTPVNYPVVKCPEEDNEYYLMRNFDGSSGYPGTIFTEHKSGTSFSAFNTILYGHNMRNGTMFACIRQYRNRDYADKHEYVYVYTDRKAMKFKVTRACVIDDRHMSNTYGGYETDDNRTDFLQYIDETTVMKTDEENKDLSIHGPYITLSTCDGIGSNNRFIAIAKLEAEKYYGTNTSRPAAGTPDN